MTENERASKLMIPCEQLQNIYPSSVPPAPLVFDQNGILFLKLKQLATRNKLADNEADKVLEVFKQIKYEYRSSECMARNTLQKLHLTPEQFSVTTKKHLKKIANCNQFQYFGQHPIKKACSDAHIALEVAKLAMQEGTIKRRIRAVTKSDSDIKKQIAVLDRELSLVRDEYELLKVETNRKVDDANVCSSKDKRIQDVLQQQRMEMISKGIPDKMKYKTVLENYEDLQAMKNEVTEVQEEIQKYYELPSDMEQAMKVLWEAKREHEELMQQISNKIHFTLQK